ncbi:MAG: oligoendopeptidase F [Ignavibacteria bacterium]|jgi:oligoendopeptidase F
MEKTILIFVMILLVSTVFAQDKTVPNYSTTPRKDIPVEFTWKIEDLYATPDDWKADKDAFAGMVTQIDAKSKGWNESPEKMLDMMEFAESLYLKGERLYAYASNSSNMELSNPVFQMMKGELQSIYVQISSKMSFIREDILKMDDNVMQEYFKKEPKLENFRKDYEDIKRAKDHILPQDNEKIISQTGLFTNTPSQTSSYLRDVDMPAPEITLSDGTKVLLNTANFSKYRGGKNPQDRTLVMNTFFGNYKKYENTLASLLDGAMKQHLFTAKVRKYKDCLNARLFEDNIDENVYYSLIKNMHENLGPLHRFMKLKKELLGLDKMRYEDIYASAVKSIDKIYTYDEAVKLVLEAVKPLGEEYVAALKNGFESRWVDIYPNKDKQTGAYSYGIYGVHPFVKMNYDGEYDAVSTLAHELGHSMHSYFSSKTQTYSKSQYPTFLAEIASTFNENLLMDYMLKNEKDDLFKLYLLDNYLDQARGTIYRQTLFAEFELAMHQRVEEGKTLTPEWLNKKYLDLTREYYGHDKGVMEVDEYIQNEWSYIPHFYMNYYVFQYSTGMISSMALSKSVLDNVPDAKEKYLGMLKAGGSDFPMEILKKAGVDLTQETAYKDAFKRFDELVNEMEKLVTKLKAEGKLK